MTATGRSVRPSLPVWSAWAARLLLGCPIAPCEAPGGFDRDRTPLSKGGSRNFCRTAGSEIPPSAAVDGFDAPVSPIGLTSPDA